MAAISGAAKTTPSSSKTPNEPVKTTKSAPLEKTKQKKDVDVKDDNEKDKDKGKKKEKNEKEKGKDTKKSQADKDKDKATVVPTNVAGTFFFCHFVFFVILIF
jgi:hypothetical protein